jgi:hypothetical protein
MKLLQRTYWIVITAALVFAMTSAACGDSGGSSEEDPDSGLLSDGGEDFDGGEDIDGGEETGSPVGSACGEHSECSGPDPVCIQEDIAPLSEFSESSSDVARELGEAVVIPIPDSYCSNQPPCLTDEDCGIEGRCFLPLADVDEDEYGSMVEMLELPQEEEETLKGFHSYGQCLRPCEGNEDCTRPGYHCAVPLENFLLLVEDMGARMETYCIGEPPDPCDPDPCENGTCVDEGDGTFTCDCEEGWTGELCDTEVPCEPNPCVNGTCIDEGDGTFTCDCDEGWTGELCDIEDPCDPDPCLRGTCIDEGDGTFTCDCDEGWSGELCDVGDPCDPNPCANGTCTDQGDGTFLCDCDEGWTGELCDVPPEEPQYCDVLYEVTATFRVSDAPDSCGDVSNTMSDNSTVPNFDDNQTTPFNTTDYPTAFIRLRFSQDGGGIVDGGVSLIEYYLPVEFLVDCTGADVTTDVDHSVGLLEMSGSPLEVQPSPGLSRPCQPWATGQLAGTILDWSACDVVPPDSGTWWSHDDAQAEGGDTTTACAMRMSVWGNVICDGWACFMVPDLGNQLNTWDQLLNNFEFSSTDYETATFTMPEVQVPESTNENNTRTWVTIDSATPIHIECGAQDNLTCDETAP